MTGWWGRVTFGIAVIVIVVVGAWFSFWATIAFAFGMWSL